MDDMNNPNPAAAPEPLPATPEEREWQETWKQKLSGVDDQIVEFFRHAGETGHDLGEKAKAKVQDWLDHTDMDEKARANWEKAKSDGKLFGTQVENRITHLVENGKIKWAEWTKKKD
jgi:hypothetical protein